MRRHLHVDEKMKRVFEEVRKYHLLYDPDDALFENEAAREHALSQLAAEFSMPGMENSLRQPMESSTREPRERVPRGYCSMLKLQS